MAESATGTRKGRRAAARDTEDSIDAEFGGDYSEASLELFRLLGRKGAQFGQVEPWEELAVQPPAQEECDAAVEELESFDRALDQIKRHTPDAKELAWIDYKRALVEDASDSEVTWLKLKAYHHGLDMLRASCGQQEVGVAASPADLDGPSSRQQADVAILPSDVTGPREAVLKAVRTLLTSSCDEEDGASATFTPDASPRQASHTHASSIPGAATPVSDLGSSIATAAAAAVPATTGTIYNPDYLEELRLTRQLAQQQQQRSMAFLLGLTTAMGISLLRWWLRRSRRSSKNGGGSTVGSITRRLAAAAAVAAGPGQPAPQ